MLTRNKSSLSQLNLKQLQQLAREFNRPIKENRRAQLQALLSIHDQVGGYVETNIDDIIKVQIKKTYNVQEPNAMTLRKLEGLEGYISAVAIFPKETQKEYLQGYVAQNKINFSPNEWADILISKGNPKFENIPIYLAENLTLEPPSRTNRKLKSEFKRLQRKLMLAAMVTDSVELFKKFELPGDIVVFPKYNNRLDIAISLNADNVALYLFSKGDYPTKISNALIWAATNGDLQLMELLYNGEPNPKFLYEPLKKASANGHLDIVKFVINVFRQQNWILNHNAMMRTKDALVQASAKGHLDIVKFLTNEFNYPESVLIRAFEAAYINGRVEILNFYISQKETTETIESIIRKNIFDLGFAITKAVASRNLPMLQFMIENNLFHKSDIGNLYKNASTYGELAIIESAKTIGLYPSEAAYFEALRRARGKVSDFLITNRAYLLNERPLTTIVSRLMADKSSTAHQSSDFASQKPNSQSHKVESNDSRKLKPFDTQKLSEVGLDPTVSVGTTERRSPTPVLPNVPETSGCIIL